MVGTSQNNFVGNKYSLLLSNNSLSTLICSPLLFFLIFFIINGKRKSFLFSVEIIWPFDITIGLLTLISSVIGISIYSNVVFRFVITGLSNI